MDPVSHLVMGRAVVAALDRNDGSRFGPGAGLAGLVGALAPDIDCVLMPAGWDIYLRVHQAGTHSLAGACVVGCAGGVVIRWLVPGSRLWALAAAASLAALSHLLLDVLSGAPLGLAWPLLPTRAAMPLVAMAEPWLIAVFVAGAAAMWIRRAHQQRAALVTLMVVAAFFGLKARIYGQVFTAMAADPRIDPAALHAIEARWGSWSEWNVFEKDADALRGWRVNGALGRVVPLLVWPIGADPPLVVSSRSLDTVRNFLSVHDLGFAVERRIGPGRVEVLWSDVRYCSRVNPPPGTIECALWFGGVFESTGRAITQVVRLGGWSQTRSP